VAEQIIENLPKTPDEQAQMVESGYELARQMGWSQVASNYVVPAMERAIRKRRAQHVA